MVFKFHLKIVKKCFQGHFFDEGLKRNDEFHFSGPAV